MDAAVIGVAGVGMAHVCALVRRGHTVKAIIDNDPEVLVQAQRRWRNEWDGTVEEVPKQKGCEYLESIPKDLRVDLAIIATPPNTHADLLAQLVRSRKTAKRIMVEKPLCFTVEDLHARNLDELGLSKVKMSCEWLYHSALRSGHKSTANDLPLPISLGMCYKPSNKTMWERPLTPLLDFGPHLLGILESRGVVVQRVQLSKYEPRSFAGMAYYKNSSAEPTFIFGSYDEKETAGLIWDEKRLEWEYDLFDRQLKGGLGLGLSTALRHQENLYNAALGAM